MRMQGNRRNSECTECKNLKYSVDTRQFRESSKSGFKIIRFHPVFLILSPALEFREFQRTRLLHLQANEYRHKSQPSSERSSSAGTGIRKQKAAGGTPGRLHPDHR